MDIPQFKLCFETLANELRLQIINSLEKGPKSVEDLADGLKAERSRVSHSLKMLLDCGYVDVRREGKHRVYALKREAIDYYKNTKGAFGMLKAAEHHMSNICQNDCKKIHYAAKQPISEVFAESKKLMQGAKND